MLKAVGTFFGGLGFVHVLFDALSELLVLFLDETGCNGIHRINFREPIAVEAFVDHLLALHFRLLAVVFDLRLKLLLYGRVKFHFELFGSVGIQQLLELFVEALVDD